MEKYRVVKITGINGFEYFVGFESISHDWAVAAKPLGVTTEIIYTNKHYSLLFSHCIQDNLSDLVVLEGSINKNRLANCMQIWHLDNMIRQKIINQNIINKKELHPEKCA